MSRKERPIDLTRWRAWAAALAGRRRRLGGRIAGVAAVLARPRLAGGRTVREQQLVAPRTLVSKISNQLSIQLQPLLRFEVRPAAAVHRTLHAIHLAIRPLLRSELRYQTQTVHRSTESLQERTTIERIQQSSSSTLRVLEAAAPPRLVSEPPRIAPLALVLQRLREPERRAAVQAARENPAARPALARRLAGKVRRQENPVGPPAARVLRQDAAAARSDHDSSSSSIHPSPRGPQAQRSAPDVWSETRAAAAVPAAAVLSPAGVEALTEKVMQQIDRRLHVWRERRGGF